MRTKSSESHYSSDDRRSFLRKGLAAGAAGAALGLLGDRPAAIAQNQNGQGGNGQGGNGTGQSGGGTATPELPSAVLLLLGLLPLLGLGLLARRRGGVADPS